MTDSTENLELQGGEQGAPLPESSQSGQAPSSPAEAKTIEVVLQEINRLKGDIRGLQAIIDTGMAGVNKDIRKQVFDLQEQLKVYEKYRENMPADKAYREMMIDELIASRTSNNSDMPVAPHVSPGKPIEAPKVDREAIARNNGVDITSADYTEIAGLESDEDYISQLVALATGRYVSTTMPPNPAAIMPTSPVGQSIPKATPEQYIKEMQAARGKGYEAGRQIKDKYRKLGVKVDEISLA